MTLPQFILLLFLLFYSALISIFANCHCRNSHYSVFTVVEEVFWTRSGFVIYCVGNNSLSLQVQLFTNTERSHFRHLQCNSINSSTLKIFQLGLLNKKKCTQPKTILFLLCLSGQITVNSPHSDHPFGMSKHLDRPAFLLHF